MTGDSAVDPVPDGFRIHHVVEQVDTDDSGVVHFSRHPSLVESALLRGLAARGGGMLELRALGLVLVVSRLRVSYHAPARFLDRLEVSAAVRDVGAVQCRASGTVVRRSGDGPPLLLSRTELVFGAVDAETGEPAALPAAIRHAILADPTPQGRG
ncbi:acyl-CoA thioesterase [Streptomyces sp. GMR22]|uniref:acyl-CoA thioesterase n=1 Tax=Streptomyces sp. GMR22 TaxID=2759524 RepID=UPI0015FA7049|nr:thioesterase family protein [Streptomyces sp. GMR22]MBA6439086.1 acyl-CoA thioesterase [Streptomyces sp. GMR22]